QQQQQQQQQQSMKKIQIKSNKRIKTLSNFIPYKSYKTFSFDATTSFSTIEELVMEAERTYKFTVFLYDDIYFDTHYLQIELVQESSSIIINIEFFTGHNLVLPHIDELLSVVFHPSKFIQIWDLPDQFRYKYPVYPVYRTGGILQCHIVNIQDDFKI
ncbi:unnamed protein product, partial [Rotaria sp. Silwood2]